MRPSVSIPECWGIYGVHESGGWDQVTCRQSTAEREDPSSPVTHDLNHLLSSYDTFESGGIMIHRPLLGFSKQRLIDTCHNLSVTWEEDKTNQDASRTPRNTIRALLRGAALPQALQKKSILDLITRASECNRTLVRTAEYMFSRCEILLFDARSGGLIVRLPTELVTLQLLYHRKKRLAALISSVAMLLRRLVDSVTPQEEVSLQSLKHAVMSTFRILNDTGDVSTRLQPTRFTVAGVEFQRIHLPLPEQRSGPRPVSVRTERRVISGRELDPLYVWKITRQPFYRSPRSVLVLPSKSNSLSVSSKEHESTNTSPWCTWQLWDGRYWIRILNRSSHTVIVRNFQSSDIENVRCSLGRERWKGFHERLRLAVPGKTRWTLPAIAELSGGDNHSGKVLALPSLGQLGIIEVANEKGETTVEWEIRYKHIMLGHSIGDENAVRNRDVITTWKK